MLAQVPVVTNFHVIKGADEIQVILTDGRNFKAKLLGSDQKRILLYAKLKQKYRPGASSQQR